MLGSAGRVAGVQSDGRRGAIRPGGGQRELHGRGPGLRAGGRAFGLGVAVEREPAAREQLEAVGPPATGDERQLLAPCGAEKQFDSASRLARFEKDTGEPHGSPRRVEALAQIVAEVDALLSGGEREVHVPDRERHD